MAIPIPIGEQKICTVISTARKRIRCEQCGKTYVYVAARQGEGAAANMLWLRGEQANREAQMNAVREAHMALARAIDPVPCPNCGWLQSCMIGQARQAYLCNLHRIGLMFPVLGLVLLFFFVPARQAFPDSQLLSIGFRLDQCAIIGGPLLIALRFFLARRYQPNAEPVVKRLQAGRARAVIVNDAANAG